MKIQFFKIFISVLFSLFFLNSQSQEFDCKIQVTSQQIQGTNKQIFQTLQKELYEFINNRRWTENVYSVEERIDCNIMISITEELSVDEFKGKIQVQSRRPVYGTSYNSTILNYVDNNLQFRYVEFEPLEYNESGTNSNLINLIVYYLNVILAYDYDSFSLEGGTPYWQKAELVVNRSQNAQEKGWKAFESLKNRYWLVENALNERYSGIRTCLFEYHRNGLDIMAQKTSEGRSNIAESLRLLQSVHRDKPGGMMMQVFFDAKGDEFVNIFGESFPDEQNRVIEILSEIDPSNTSKYSKIINSEGQSGSQPNLPGGRTK
jgi:hypothetical protein